MLGQVSKCVVLFGLDFPVALSLHQSRDQIAYSTRPAWTDSFLSRNHRWALPRRQRTGCADGRAGSLLHHGSWLTGLLPPSHAPSSWGLLCHPRPQDLRFDAIFPNRSIPTPVFERSHRATSRVLLAQSLPRQTTHGAFLDSEQDRRFCFLSNHLLLPALTICQLYKMRWQVELFFKWIKQHLRIKRFYGNSINAVKTQVWIAVCVYVLVAILKKECNCRKVYTAFYKF